MAYVVERIVAQWRGADTTGRRQKWWRTQRRAYFDAAVEVLKELYGHTAECPGSHGGYEEWEMPNAFEERRCAFHRITGSEFDGLVAAWIVDLMEADEA